jgi:hypothetical protein
MGLLGGVEATQLDANTMRISARGNRFSDIRRMKDYVMLKAAQETAAHGFSLFYVMDSENVTRTDTISIPEFHSAPVVATAMTPNGPVMAIGTANYTTEQTKSITRPGEDITVKMMNGTKPDNAPPNLYSAAEVMTYLGGRILGDQNHIVQSSVAPTSLVTTDVPPADSPVPSPICTKNERQLAQMAKQNGFQYHGPCE